MHRRLYLFLLTQIEAVERKRAPGIGIRIGISLKTIAIYRPLGNHLINGNSLPDWLFSWLVFYNILLVDPRSLKSDTIYSSWYSNNDSQVFQIHFLNKHFVILTKSTGSNQLQMGQKQIFPKKKGEERKPFQFVYKSPKNFQFVATHFPTHGSPFESFLLLGFQFTLCHLPSAQLNAFFVRVATETSVKTRYNGVSLAGEYIKMLHRSPGCNLSLLSLGKITITWDRVTPLQGCTGIYFS